MSTDEARILNALVDGPKATPEVAIRRVDGEGHLGWDMAPLHALWRAGRIRWDWLAEKWRLPTVGEVAS